MSALKLQSPSKKAGLTKENGHFNAQVEIQVESTDQPLGMGWVPDHPDFRDYTLEHREIKLLLEGTKLLNKVKPAAAPTAPVSVDLRPWCSPIENQGSLGSCTAN